MAQCKGVQALSYILILQKVEKNLLMLMYIYFGEAKKLYCTPLFYMYFNCMGIYLTLPMLPLAIEQILKTKVHHATDEIS